MGIVLMIGLVVVGFATFLGWLIMRIFGTNCEAAERLETMSASEPVSFRKVRDEDEHEDTVLT